MLCLLGRSLPGEAQQARSVSRVGVLLAGAPGAHVEAVEVFRQGLRELGWSEGQNLVLDLRYADNNYDRLSDLAADLVALKPDAIFAAAAPAIRAATQATTTIPIVSETLGDAVSAALASSSPAPVYQQQTQVSVAPLIQREVCYPSGCYHLQGDGVTVAYSWVWVPAAPAAPPEPSAPPGR